MTRVIAVLGMHRSGTSCLTGMLENAGMGLGNVSRKNPFNRKGNNENLRIMALHESLLADNSSRWDAPPLDGCEWSARHHTRQTDIIAEYSQLPIWGFKDPRTLFTLEGWIRQLPHMELIGSFRHPAAVARSLVSRGGGDFSHALKLWLAYNRRLLTFQDSYGFDLICFDLPPDKYVEQVAKACRRLGLDLEKDALTFFEAGLRNQQSANNDLPLPSEVVSVYSELLKRSL